MSTLSVIIPSKNRPELLCNLVYNLLFNQTHKPDEVIVIDQSDTDLSLPTNISHKVNYFHVPNINGLVEAKDYGVKKSTCSYICFLDDDSCPEQNFLSELIIGMKATNAIGMCGFVSNYQHTSNLLKFIYPIFHHGYFRGDRIGTFGVLNSHIKKKYIPTNQITGGCSIWDREVFDQVSFDLDNCFHYFEDVDFSYQVSLKYKNRLYINTRAYIEDLHNQLGLVDYESLIFRRVLECKKVYKKYNGVGGIPYHHYLLYLMGRFFQAISLSFTVKSFSLLTAFFKAIRLREV